MIGMSQIRKRLIYGIAIGAGIGVIGIVAVLIWAISVVNSYKDGTNKDYIANHTTEIVTLSKDVIQGETITDEMLTKARVHKSAAPTDAAGYEVVGMIAKYNIPANIPLVSDMFGEQIVTVDERIQEISSVMLPTGLMEGEYIDIKIKMASGLEYVVLPQIKIEKIFGTTVWMHLDEEELYLLNSAIVDTYLNEGVVLYGVRYVDPTTQIKTGDLLIDENGDEINISDLARRKLSKKIEDDVAKGTVALTVPTEVTSIEETTEVSDEYINFSDNLTDLILKYAIEYRYYVESYNKVYRTYEPSDIVMEHMRANRYITDEAKESLNADNRRQIEEKIRQFKDSTGEESFGSAVVGLTAQIAAQQAVRTSTLAGE